MDYKQKPSLELIPFLTLTGAGLATVPDNFVDLVCWRTLLMDRRREAHQDQRPDRQHPGSMGNRVSRYWECVEDYYEWLKPFIAEFVRVLKDSGSLILFLDRKYTGLIIRKSWKHFDLNFKNKIYFKKKNPVPSIRKKLQIQRNRRGCLFTKGKQYTFNFGAQADMVQFYEGSIGHKQTQHPTEKYRWMIEPLIKNHTRPGDVVLDSFAGSATTLVVASQHGCHAIGFEKERRFAMAKARMESQRTQLEFYAPDGETEIVAELDKLMDLEFSSFGNSGASMSNANLA